MANSNWLLGKHLKSVSIFTGSVAADTGVVTWSSSAIKLADAGATVQSVVDYIRISDDRMLEMICAVDAIYSHYEVTLLDFTLTIGEILSKGAGGKLASTAQGTQLLKVVFSRGTTTVQTYTFYGTIRSFNDGVQA